ncbi:hypothetical protein TYRP_021436 [Tyrophagus putrescentiae]|nr:hypothetical protein TYRP_021436 [Tyrophagus putrescentiae]
MVRLRSQTPMTPMRCFASSKPPKQDCEARITVTDDGQTIVCWHPQKQFPYEHSLPYVEAEDRSVLKAENIAKGENIYYKGPTTLKSMEEVQAITYTAKHVWRRRRFDGLQMRPDHPRKGV